MIEIDWSAQAGRLRTTAGDEAAWTESVAASLVRTTDRVAVDVGCGGGGMAKALAAALPSGATVVAIDGDPDVLAEARSHTGGAVRCELASLDDGPEPLRAAVEAPADLVWASASVHHAADQQAAINSLASLLAPGGRLALAEGGLPSRHLPWDLGIGEPGLELRLDAAQDRWFAAMRNSLPGSVPMPYGWTEALNRAGLTGVTTRTWLTERPVPLSTKDRERVVTQFQQRISWLRPSSPAAPGHHDGPDHQHGHEHAPAHSPLEPALPAEDLAVWDQLLDPDSPHFLGRRTDLAALSARSIHVGHAPV
jgi:SAM-dependent methyltransferase